MRTLQQKQPNYFGFIVIAAVISVFTVGILLARPSSAAPEANIQFQNLERITLNSSGMQGSDSSFTAWQSADSRYVTFASFDETWIGEDNTGNYCQAEDPNFNRRCLDIFIKDRSTNDLKKVTYGLDGGTADHNSAEPFLTRDGSAIFFHSRATNLVPNDTNNTDPIFQHDHGIDTFRYNVNSGTLERVSKNDQGGQIMGNSIGVAAGENNIHVLFFSDGENVIDGLPVVGQNLYLRNIATDEIEFVSPAMNGGVPNQPFSGVPSADDNLRYIAYPSLATNILPGDNNGTHDIFLYDRVEGDTKLITKPYADVWPNNGSGKPVVSPDGKYVVFQSAASNLVPNDNNGVVDVFMYDIETDTVSLVTTDVNGNPSNGNSKDPSTCNEGRLVVFFSSATNLVPGDSNGIQDAYVKDMVTGEVALVSQSASGVNGNGDTHKATINSDCQSIVFASDASNLMPGDTNNSRDIFRVEVITELPADFSTSKQIATPTVLPGGTISYEVIIRNTGDEAGVVGWMATLPMSTTVVTDSLSAGLMYDEVAGTIQYASNVAGLDEMILTFDVILDPAYTESVVHLEGKITADENTYNLLSGTIVNPESQIFLPIVPNQ